MQSVVEKALEAEGYLSEREAEFLYELARTAVDPVVEIGSYRGRSTIALALGSQAGNGVPVYAIEPHEEFFGPLGGVFGPRDRVVFFENLLRAGVAETVRLVNLPSEEAALAWRSTIGVLWIDGNHNYEAVRRDADIWLPHLSPTGLVAFHDSLTPGLGPLEVIEELERAGYERVEQVGLTAVLRRTI